MKFVILNVVLAIFVGQSLAIVHDHCSLANELKAHGVADSELATWVCLAEHSSEFNTKHIGMPDSSNRVKGYGIFQIQENIWCTSPRNMMAGQCKILCTELLDDDLTEDIKCAKFIKEHYGFMAWPKYNTHCYEAASVAHCFE